MFFFLSFVSLLVSSTEAPQQLMVKPGQNVTLQCQQSHPGTLTLLTWTRNDLQKDDFVFFFRENRPYRQYQHESFRGRVELRDSSSIKDGDFSVVLQNVSSEDAGTYRCRIVMRNPGGSSSEFEHFINLTVSGEETPEEGGGPKFGVMTLGTDAIIALIISVSVLGMVLIIFAAVQMKRKSRTPSTLHADTDEEKTPMQSEMVVIPSVPLSSPNLPAMDAVAPVPISGSRWAMGEGDPGQVISLLQGNDSPSLVPTGEKQTPETRPGSKNVKPDSLSRLYSADQPETPEPVLPASCTVGVVSWEITDLINAALASEPDPDEREISVRSVQHHIRRCQRVWKDTIATLNRSSASSKLQETPGP
ncbi:uncharacterized protein LOC119778857 [Cyprinodon tularosa]|uniref:uncharacterized protein LOC119778857 n=1 Tax=Cyprinodon tularosa TaxID=77115 RepID=UPI0018E2507D|nr:uncharacterized protein LOC119778857 [Cyprinodon tularosa]